MNISQHFSQQSKRTMIAESYLLVALLGVADYLTGSEMSFLIFYLLPVLLVSAYAQRINGLYVAIASAGVWFLADLLAQPDYAHVIIPFWNVLGILCVLLLLSLTVSTLISTLERERALARRDDVTGLANRRCFLETAQTELARARRSLRPLTLAYLDIDNFKAINDTLGHNTGDTLLRTVAETMKAHLRSTDHIARLGGDEFAILLPETTPEVAGPVIRRMRAELVSAMRRRGWPITVTIGVVTCLRLPREFDEMLHKADVLMYAGKNSGKNAIRFAVQGDQLARAEEYSQYARGA